MDSAIPHEKTMHVRFPRYLLKIDEQRFGSINSAHYENYPKFIDAGRIAARVRRRRMDIKVDRFHLGGDIGIIGVGALSHKGELNAVLVVSQSDLEINLSKSLNDITMLITNSETSVWDVLFAAIRQLMAVYRMERIVV